MGSGQTNNNKRIAKNTFYLYIRMIVSLAISLYTSRVFLEILGVEDYGIYNIVGGFVAMLSILTNTIRSAAQRFITYTLGTGDFEKLKRTFSTFVTLYLLTSLIIFVLGEGVGILTLDKILQLPQNRIDAAFFVFHCSLITFVVNLNLIPYNACVISHEKMNFFAFVSILDSILKLLIVYLLYINPYDDLKTFAVLLCIVSFLNYFIYVIYCKRYFSESKVEYHIDKNIFKEVFSYSMWVIIGSSSAVVKEQGVNIVINNFCGVIMNAAKGVSVQVEHVVGLFATNIGTAITPQITKSYAAGDVKRSINLTFLMAKVQGLLLLFLCLPLITEADMVLSLWLNKVPDHAVLFTQWVLILCIARTLENSVVPLHLAIGKQKYIQIICGCCMLLNLPFSYVVLKLGADPVATVMVGIVLEMVVLFGVTLFLKRYINFPILLFFKSSILSVLLIGFSTLCILFYIKTLLINSLVQLLVVCVLSSFLICITSYYFALNKREKEVVTDFVRNKLKKYKR